jgi:maleate isomerase
VASGFRARLGIICPAPTVAPEAEFPRVLPDGVSLCATRIPLLAATKQGLLDSLQHAYQAGALLAQARVDVIGFLCTTATLARGAEFDRQFAEQMQRQTGIRTVTTAAAAAAALSHLEARRVVVATPYAAELNAMEKEFLEHEGFEVAAIEGLGVTDPDSIRELTADAAYRLCRKLWRPQADALFFSCTGVPTFGMIRMLEEDIGKPVITSNQASLWHMLRSAGVNAAIGGLGRLLAER